MALGRHTDFPQSRYQRERNHRSNSSFKVDRAFLHFHAALGLEADGV